MASFAKDFVMLSKKVMTPIERVKILSQIQRIRTVEISPPNSLVTRCYSTKRCSCAFDNKCKNLFLTDKFSPQYGKNLVSTSRPSERSIHLSTPNRMFIQVEETPNPNSLKFYPGENVLESGTVDFQDKVAASMKSPLAKSLFRIKGVKSVFFAQDFITVTKEDDDSLEWKVMKPQIFSAIMIFYTMKQPVLFDEPDVDSNAINENDSEIVKEIKQLIEDRIRPTIQEDGGDLAFVAYEDGVVKLRLQGACTSCPSSIVTLRSGIKNMLQFYIPDVKDVEQVT